jgi:uncharacterized membrane protein SpoIIM required for sporulation
MQKINHSKILRSGWFLTGGFFALWALVSLTVYGTVGLAESERIAMMLALVFLCLSPILLLFLGYSLGYTFITYKTKKKWLLVLPSLLGGAYLIFALLKIEWN